MSSLAEARQLFLTLVDCEQQAKRVQLEADLAKEKLGDAYRIASGLMSLMRRMGLPENVERALMKLMRILTILRSIQNTLYMMQFAGPMGLLLGAIDVTASLMAAYSYIDLERPRY